jgi:hypothetical protein
MEKSGASDLPASRLYLNIPLAGKTLRGDPLWNHASAERVTAPARTVLQDAGGNAGMSAKFAGCVSNWVLEL